MKTERNKSGETTEMLARIYFEDVLTKLTPDAIYDSGISFDLIIHVPMFLAGEDHPEILTDLIDDGDLDELFGREIKTPEQLNKLTTFIVRGTVQKWDFSKTKFDVDGRMDSCSSDWGRYIIYGCGQTLEEAYQQVVEMAVKRIARSIEKGLKP